MIKNIIKETSDPYEWMHANENNMSDYIVDQMNCKLFNNAINENLLREIIKNKEEFSFPERIENGFRQIIVNNGPLCLVICLIFWERFESRSRL